MLLPEWLHRLLRLPYFLHISKQGYRGPTLIFLHGIAADQTIWHDVTPSLMGEYQIIKIDLLGHGKSPKPTHLRYTAQDHARSIRWTLFWHRFWGEKTFVGHSMGSLISTYLAAHYRHYVARLVLVAMPIYQPNDMAGEKSLRLEGLIDKVYLRFYRALRTLPKQHVIRSVNALVKAVPSLVGQAMLDEQTWYPVASSLKNTIENQCTTNEIKQLPSSMPVTVVYGTLDNLVISGNLKKAFKERGNTVFYKVLAPHEVTKSFAHAIARSIREQIPSGKSI